MGPWMLLLKNSMGKDPLPVPLKTTKASLDYDLVSFYLLFFPPEWKSIFYQYIHSLYPLLKIWLYISVKHVSFLVRDTTPIKKNQNLKKSISTMHIKRVFLIFLFLSFFVGWPRPVKSFDGNFFSLFDLATVLNMFFRINEKDILNSSLDNIIL